MTVTQTLSHEGRHSSSYHYLNLPQGTVHTFQINVLQLILGFYTPCWKKVLEILVQCTAFNVMFESPHSNKVLQVVSSGPQTCDTCNKHAVHSTPKFCWWNWIIILWMLFFRSPSVQELLLYIPSCKCLISKNHIQVQIQQIRKQ